MDLGRWLHIWQVTAVTIAVLDIAALGLLIWLGSIDEREQGLGL